MRKTILLSCIIYASVALYCQHSIAGHAAGSDITLEQVGLLEYKITVKLFRDCADIPASRYITINYESASHGYKGIATLDTSTYLSNGSPNGTEVFHRNCNATPGVSTCQGGIRWGIEEWQYEGVVVLPFIANDWLFTYSVCCRSYSIDNLIISNSLQFSVYTILNNSNVYQNSTPTFTGKLVSTACVGSVFEYDQGVTDLDGDSLVYSFG
ncbi:MAG: hypothetical protein HKN22_00615, partial [Bacteroidia bacterium]|nr:hypothetical protein [Bacteroidia bacterium]